MRNAVSSGLEIYFAKAIQVLKQKQRAHGKELHAKNKYSACAVGLLGRQYT